MARRRVVRHSLKSLTLYAEGLEHSIAVTQISLARIGQQLEETKERLTTLEKRNYRHAGTQMSIEFLRDRVEALELATRRASARRKPKR